MELLTVRCTLPSHRAICAGVDSALLHVELFYFLNNGFWLCNWHSLICHLECLMYWVECSHTLVPSSLWPTWEHVFSLSQKKPWSCERSGVPISLSRRSLSQPLTCLPSVPRSVRCCDRRATLLPEAEAGSVFHGGAGSHVTRAPQWALALLLLIFSGSAANTDCTRAIQPSHPLSSPSPPALSLSQHQGLF